MGRFRIKEIAINKDGTNVWFYPEVLIIQKRKPQWFWKLVGKSTTIEEHHNFFDKDDYVITLSKKEVEEMSYWESEKIREKIIAFRDKEEAEHWLVEHISKLRKESALKNEKLYKYFGGISETDTGIKSHDVKID